MQMETAEQKQTHGSGRILKPGPYSIKALLGPSSLEAPLLLCCQHSRPVDTLSLSLLLSLWSSVEQLPASLPRPACFTLVLLSYIVMTAAVVMHATAKAREA